MAKIFRVIACAAAFFASASAMAAVEYSFSGFFSNNNWPNEVNYTGGFSFVVDNYLQTDEDISPANMLTCHAGDQLCSKVHFFQDAHAAGLTGDLGVQAIGLADHDGSMGYYYFSAPAFSTPGSYNSLYGFNPGTLTVSAVPEPANWLSLITGMVLIGALTARSRKPDIVLDMGFLRHALRSMEDLLREISQTRGGRAAGNKTR